MSLRKDIAGMDDNELSAFVREASRTASWLQGLAAEAQRAAVFARTEIRRRRRDAAATTSGGEPTTPAASPG